MLQVFVANRCRAVWGWYSVKDSKLKPYYAFEAPILKEEGCRARLLKNKKQAYHEFHKKK